MKMKNTPLHKAGLSLLTAVLLWGAWPAAGIAPLLFIALIPLLVMEEAVYRQQMNGEKSRLFPYVYLTFLLFNFFTTWWIRYASFEGMIGAVLANALLMTLVFQFFHFTRKQLGNVIGYTSLVVYWMGFEYFHMDWDLTWPWLNLGNGFAGWANMVQWYEYTGTQGGTLWIWCVNILLFHLLHTASGRKKMATGLLFLITLPLLTSWVILRNYQESSHPVEVVVVQPNIDPYNEKFNGTSDAQLEKMLKLASSGVSSSTRLVVCPETALPDGIWNEELSYHPQINRIKAFLLDHPQIRFLTGLSYYKLYKSGETLSETARTFRNSPGYFDAYNAGLQLDTSQIIQLHYKSKLVPGVEKMPFPVIFGYLENYAIDLGGTTGSLGVSDHPAVFTGDSIYAAPVICYESVYGDYVGEYVRSGANLICIMTNDGWWNDTPGYRQHCQYARLRAIEHRRSIARSANTGTSCFIDQTGTITQATGWWVPAVIKTTLNLNNELTFYSRHGDLLGKSTLYISGFLMGITILSGITGRRKESR
jgi:apolipoprotein N-acyltransferase